MTVPSKPIMLLTSSNLIVILYYIESVLRKSPIFEEKFADLEFRILIQTLDGSSFIKGLILWKNCNLLPVKEEDGVYKMSKKELM